MGAWSSPPAELAGTTHSPQSPLRRPSGTDLSPSTAFEVDHITIITSSTINMIIVIVIIIILIIAQGQVGLPILIRS
ncbi:uncharacterized protein BP01DRAFT_10071 [Aspergillus saccharolyticus JOP 1030-1]|uniref:Uncharacterized protein n=1 Tax=Aspergillus saccharolyticus JOP 1030-1 TaxID=1450539 RepID=A0A318ZQS4_9EURO|nr:hypothetical protein BP01DRAFT_10071 [Aspergillus saccharolyticus JOP 1030-1]PYH49951.1 hypothetical protein BP01DRAFT_10071 [Aspergillus saccharolyticus JOP 1030-1]